MGDTGAPAPGIDGLARSIEDGLRARADSERRTATEGYFPTDLLILGVSAPAIRDVIREHAPDWRALSAREAVTLAAALHDGGIHEGRQAGYEILERRNDTHALLDRATLEGLGEGNDNWASVDTFATRVAGPAWREGRIDDDTVRAWASSPDPWWRRTAVVCTVALNIRARGGTGDPARTLDIVRRVVNDPDDMVAKALSWALRSLVQHDAAAVRGFLAEHEGVLAARVNREVRKKLETGRKA